jgi:drug/metabolite transporter (DMT)-like permease
MEMSATVMMAVLGAALLHAAWNGLIKSSDNKQLDSLATAIGAGAIGIVSLPWLPAPAPESWPWLAGSVLIRVPYFLFLAGAYRWGDLSYTYPLMRGGGAILVLVFGAVVFGEFVASRQVPGVLLICAGIIGFASGAHDRRATWFALANAVVIAAYTLIDAKGVRASGAPLSYTMWFFAGMGLLLGAVGLVQHGRALTAYLARRLLRTAGGGACTVGGYGIALWAMTQAPVALVAVLRETSVLFAAAIGALLLGEKFTRKRIVATVAVVTGLMLLGANR